jgi:hypothetical protein
MLLQMLHFMGSLRLRAGACHSHWRDRDEWRERRFEHHYYPRYHYYPQYYRPTP